MSCYKATPMNKDIFIKDQNRLPRITKTYTINGRIKSKKNSKRIVRNRYTGRPLMVSSVAFMHFAEDAIDQLRRQHVGLGTLPAPYFITYIFEMKGRSTTDADNMEASVNDIIQTASKIYDDKHIIDHETIVRYGAKAYRCVVIITGNYQAAQFTPKFIDTP